MSQALVSINQVLATLPFFKEEKDSEVRLDGLMGYFSQREITHLCKTVEGYHKTGLEYVAFVISECVLLILGSSHWQESINIINSALEKSLSSQLGNYFIHRPSSFLSDAKESVETILGTFGVCFGQLLLKQILNQDPAQYEFLSNLVYSINESAFQIHKCLHSSSPEADEDGQQSESGSSLTETNSDEIDCYCHRMEVLSGIKASFFDRLFYSISQLFFSIFGQSDVQKLSRVIDSYENLEDPTYEEKYPHYFGSESLGEIYAKRISFLICSRNIGRQKAQAIADVCITIITA